LRKAQTKVHALGGDAIALVLQGCLVDVDIIAEAGQSAQPKAKHGKQRGQRKLTMGVSE
jgi:hypothetical protein